MCNPLAALVDHTNTPVQRGIAALRSSLGEDNVQALLQAVPPRADEVTSYSFPLPIDYTDTERRLRIGFPKGFPLSGLRLTVNPSPWLIWPHAMKEGVCLHGFNERPLTGTPEIVVKDSLARLSNIIRLSQKGSCPSARATEFQREITSYWFMQQKPSPHNLILLDRPQTAARLFALSAPQQAQPSASKTIWLAADSSSLEKHFRHTTGSSPKMRALQTPAFYVKLQSCPPLHLPAPGSLLTWLDQHISPADKNQLSAWFKEHSSLLNLWIAMELPGDPPAPIYCLNICNYRSSQNRGLTFNLRTARHKTATPISRPLTKIKRTKLEVLIRSEVLSRDLSGVTESLDKKHVVCVGVGSLGGFVAMQLARSGVGHLTLIDPDYLESANLGRHVLGAKNLGYTKAKALQEKIRQNLPITDVSIFESYAEVMMKRQPEIFDNADLVVVTTADWQSEASLWRLKSKGTSWSLLQAWSEPHAFVGHVLLAPAGAADAQMLFAENGDFKHKFTKWPQEGIIPLPACGESFIPGGAVGIANIAAMVTQAALRALNGDISTSLWLSSVNRTQDVAKLEGVYLGPALPTDIQHAVWERGWPEPEE